MARAKKRRPLFVDPNAKVWTTDEDVYLIENQDVPLEEQADTLGCTVDDVSNRRGTLGLLQRARAIMRLCDYQKVMRLPMMKPTFKKLWEQYLWMNAVE